MENQNLQEPQSSIPNPDLQQPKKSYGHNWKKLIPLYLVVGLLLYAGIYYFLSQQKSKPYKTVTPTVSEIPSSSPTTIMQKVDSANATTDQENARKQAQAFYREFLTATSPDNGGLKDKPTYIDGLEMKGYITKNAVMKIKAAKTFDAVSCSQNPLAFEFYKFSTPVITGSNATMTVTGSYNGTGTPIDHVITLNLIKSNTQWSIDSFTCPPEPTVAQ